MSDDRTKFGRGEFVPRRGVREIMNLLDQQYLHDYQKIEVLESLLRIIKARKKS